MSKRDRTGKRNQRRWDDRPVNRPTGHQRPADVVDRASARPVNRQALYDDAMKVEGSTMDFLIERDVPGDDPALTFSREAIEGLSAAMDIWLGTRIIRHFEGGKTGPKKLRATLTVTLDDEAPIELPLNKRPFFIADGTHRRDN